MQDDYLPDRVRYSPKSLEKHIDRRYLLNTKNGRVFPWMPILAVRPDMVPCNENGVPTKAPSLNDPYLKHQNAQLAQQLAAAGAERETVMGFGMLLDDLSKAYGTTKIEKRSEDWARIAGFKQEPEWMRGALALAEKAKWEIEALAVAGYWQISGRMNWQVKPPNEVSLAFQRRQAMAAIDEHDMRYYGMVVSQQNKFHMEHSRSL
jgi:hypothetical protein